MKTPDSPDMTDALPEALRWQLRAMRRDEAPGVDPWPSIAQRLAGTRQVTGAARQSPNARTRWAVPVSLAATLVAALGFAGWWQGAPVPDAPSLVQREASGLTRQYEAALVEVRMVPGPASTALQPAFDDLDQNIRLILDALARDPDSRLLLEQLRRTYSHRLALAQRVALS